MMNTLYKTWCVWSVVGKGLLLDIQKKGTLEECVRFVEPRLLGAFVIMPYEPLDK